MKQVAYWRPTNIRCQRTKFSRQGFAHRYIYIFGAAEVQLIWNVNLDMKFQYKPGF